MIEAGILTFVPLALFFIGARRGALLKWFVYLACEGAVIWWRVALVGWNPVYDGYEGPVAAVLDGTNAVAWLLWSIALAFGGNDVLKRIVRTYQPPDSKEAP